MKLIKLTNLEQCLRDYPHARVAVGRWVGMVRAATWGNPSELVAGSFVPARTIENGRVIFNIKGNEYRLICAIKYADRNTGFPGILYFKFFGSHAEYDKVDPATVEFGR